MIGRWSLLACSILALAVALVACDDDGGDGDGASPAASPEATALTVADWADQVCALAVEAADTLDVPDTEDPSALTLEERKQRASEVLAPRAEALGETADQIAALEPPQPAAEFHEVLHTTMADISIAWLDLVDVADRAQSGVQIDAGNETFMQAQDVADAEVVDAYEALGADVTAALSQPEDCGILNEIRS